MTRKLWIAGTIRFEKTSGVNYLFQSLGSERGRRNLEAVAL